MNRILITMLLLFVSVLAANAQPETDSMYLKATEFIDCDNPEIISKAKELTSDCETLEAKMKAIFNYVRDSHTDTVFKSWVAGDILRLGGNSCYQRSILMAALCRVVKIPSRLQWQKVVIKDFKLSDGKVEDLTFIHGITGVKLNGKWYLMEPVGNNQKWRVWVQKEEDNTVEYFHEKNCLFQNTDKVKLETLPIHFADYFLEMKTVRSKLVGNEIGFISK